MACVRHSLAKLAPREILCIASLLHSQRHQSNPGFRLPTDALAQAGAKVAMVDIDQSSLDAAMQRLDNNPMIMPVRADMLEESSIQKCVADVIAKLGRLDILINCAHRCTTPELDDATMADFTEAGNNIVGAYTCTAQQAGKQMRKTGGGSIINIGSMYGKVTGYPDVYKGICKPNSVVYQTGKAGVLHLTEYMAVYWAKDNIRVNAISPGPFPPPKALAELAGFEERLAAKVPLGRIGKAWEVKGAAVFLASEASSYITGQNLQIDGGWCVW